MKMEVIDLTQIIVAIIGFAGMVFSARQKVKETKVPPPQVRPSKGKPHTTTVVMWMSVALLVANLAVFGWRYWGPSAKTEVRITYPTQRDSVELREMVRGTSQKVPDGQAIWVLVFPHVAGTYYPQNAPADIQAGGDWTSLAFIGTDMDTDNKFDIIVALADEMAQGELNAYLAQYKDKSPAPGLTRIPNGTTEYHRITVTRK